MSMKKLGIFYLQGCVGFFFTSSKRDEKGILVRDTYVVKCDVLGLSLVYLWIMMTNVYKKCIESFLSSQFRSIPRDKGFLIYRYNEIEQIVNKEKQFGKTNHREHVGERQEQGIMSEIRNLYSAYFQSEHVTAGPDRLSDSAVLYFLFPKTKIHD